MPAAADAPSVSQQQNANSLADQRGRARNSGTPENGGASSFSSNPTQYIGAGAPGPQTVSSNPNTRVGAAAALNSPPLPSTLGTQSNAPKQAEQPSGEPNTPQAAAQGLTVRRAASRLGQMRKQLKEAEKQKAEAGKKGPDPNYPHPISFRTWAAFGMLAGLQDLGTLLLDLLGVGWLATWILGPIFGGFYIWKILIRAPKALVGTLTNPGPLVMIFFGNSGIEFIPVIGEFYPGWVTMIAVAYILVHQYETGGGGSISSAAKVAQKVATKGKG